MLKTLRLRLNNYPVAPHSLVDGSTNQVVDSVDVDLGRLFHHYYHDTQGCAPPEPDLAHFEHIRLLLPDAALRVRGDGFGASPEYRKSRSNDLGQAFCRWFLYEHLDITYFAHVSYAISTGVPRWFGRHTIERSAKGDMPDYLCSDNQDIYLAEAKGRTRSVSFDNAEFKEWRKQFDRIAVKDSDGKPVSVKGHIVATRFATEADSASTHSTLFAEDPASPGDQPLRDAAGLAASLKALHYVDVAHKLRQPLLAAALLSGQPLPEALRIQGIAWTLDFGGPSNMTFVGGYFPTAPGRDPFAIVDGHPVWQNHPLRLDIAPATFFGVELSVLRNSAKLPVVAM